MRSSTENILRSNHYAVYLDTLIAKLGDPNPHVKVFSYLIMHFLLEQLSGEHQINAARRVLDATDFEELNGVEDLAQTNENLLEVKTNLLFSNTD